MKKLILCFLALLLTYSNNAQTFTKGAVYDYEIGDEFHYNTTWAWNNSSNQIDRVLNKYSNSTHLFYEIGDVSLQNTTLILSSRLDSFSLAELNDFVLDTVTSGIFGDTILYRDTVIINTNYNAASQLVLFFSLDMPDNYEPPSWSQRFILGCGEVSYYKSWQGGFLSRNLVYFKKGANTWGTPVYITPLQEIKSTEPFASLSPNPFSDKISIKLEQSVESASTFELYNNTGQLILKENIKAPSAIISIPQSGS